MNKRSGPLTVVAAAVLWGTAGTAGTLAVVDSVSLAAARLVLGGAVLAVLAVTARSRHPKPHAGTGTQGLVSDQGQRVGRLGGRARELVRDELGPSRATRFPAISTYWGLGVGAGAVAAYQLCFFAAVGRTGVAIGTVVAIGSGPVFTGLLSWLIDRRRPTRRWGLATTAAIAGCAVLVTGGGTGGGTGGADAGGIALALLGGLLYAFYAVMASQSIGRGMDSAVVMGVLFGGAAVIMLPVLVTTGPGWLAEPRGLLTALYLGCATTALAYLLYGKGLRTTPVATAATLALAEPAVAALLGLVVLHEHLSAVSWSGLVLLALSLVVVALPGKDVTTPAEGVPARLGSAP